MTAVVGLAHEGKVWLGADSLSSSGADAWPTIERKVFRRGEFLMGYTTSYRFGQLLRYRFEIPPIESWEHDIAGYMATKFVDALRECLKTYAFAKIEHSREEGGTALIGVRGRLFGIWDDYQAVEFDDGAMAVGSGSRHALGALYATKSLAPLERVTLALEAAERYGTYVRRPFVVEAI